MRKNAFLALAAGTILSIASPALSQTTPAFRVPMGAAPTSSTIDATYAWLETLGSCSTTCGTGTRSTSYQCQNVADYDYGGAGYGLPEPDSACTASVGPKPSSTSASCTVYSGCGYDWVRPPVSQTPIPLDSNPVGRLGCGYVKSVFSPYCQRTGGGANVVMSASDHRFCSGDRPDYDPVANGDPDALGYDRNASQTGSCNTSDHDWRPNDATTGWGSWTGGGNGDCDSAATRTRSVSCYRRFDNSVQPDTSCSASTRPASTQTEGRYGSCSYSYSYGAYGAWSSECDTNATRTRTATCMRSNNGGQAVADSECTSRGVAKETTSETAPQYASCSYAFQPTAWSAWSSGCDANATRTRSAPCVRSNNGGQTVADTECTSRGQAKPATSETGAQYGSCTYSFSTGSWGSYNSSCSSSATRTRSVTCMRNNNGGTAVADSECTSRGIARPASSETTPQYAGCSYSAVNPGGWSGWASGCSNSTTRTRQYQCLRSNDGGQIVGDAECTSRGVGLVETQSGANYASCTYNWQYGGWSGWNSGCSPNAVRTRSVWCARDLDGATVADGYCNAGTRQPASETSAQYGSCGYARGGETGVSGWDNGCSSTANRTHYYSCIRQDGQNTVVSSAECTNRGISVTANEQGANYSGCTYRIEDAGVGACQSNNQAPHYWRCIRNQTGEQVDSSAYCGRANPTYDSCSYYTYRLEDGGVGACQSNNQAPHYWRCIRNQDGAQVDSATYCGRANPTYDACTYYTYRLEDAGVGACNGTNRPHYWRCVRNQDGAQVDSATYCGRSNPTYDSCSYTYRLEDAGLGACQTNDQAPHYWRCIRNEDGAQVDPATYCGRGNPTYEACSYPWGYTPQYGGWGSCSAAGSQSRTMVGCTRSDGTAVATSYCTNAGHAATQSQGCTRQPRCFSTTDNLYQYSCTGQEISRAGGEWSSYYGNRREAGYGDIARTQNCFNIGGTCLARQEISWSDYGDPEGGGTQYTCTNGSVVQDHTFVSDSFRQEYTEACDLQ